MPGERAASRTAVLVCQGRAVADGRIAVGRFADPVAYDLLRTPERALVDLVRRGTPPRGIGARLEYEVVRGGAALMAARTVAIDDVVRTAGAAQLVVLGAGLDARGWRMAELADVDVYEVDRPASQRDKRDRLGEHRIDEHRLGEDRLGEDRLGERRPVARSVRFVPVDFTGGDVGAGLRAAGYDPAAPTTWVWEGVVPYLTAEQVTRAAHDVAAATAPGSTLVVNYQERAVVGRVTRALVQGAFLLGRRPSPWAGEPWRSMWSVADMAALLASAGFSVGRDERLLDVADREGIAAPGRPDFGRIAVATRT